MFLGRQLLNLASSRFIRSLAGQGFLLRARGFCGTEHKTKKGEFGTESQVLHHYPSEFCLRTQRLRQESRKDQHRQRKSRRTCPFTYSGRRSSLFSCDSLSLPDRTMNEKLDLGGANCGRKYAPVNAVLWAILPKCTRTILKNQSVQVPTTIF